MADYKLPIITGTSLSAGELLRWDGSDWVNHADSAYAPAAHLHDTQTLQHDGVNSDGGAFAFNTAGVVTFNQSIVSIGLTVTNAAVIGSNSTVFQPNTDSTTFFQVLDANGGTPVLNVDTTNERVGVGTAAPIYPFHIDSQEDFGSGYFKVFTAHNSSLTSGQHVQFSIGRNASTYNQAEFNFDYVGGSGSSSNTFSLGLFGRQIMVLQGTGRVGLGTALPDHQLHIVSTTGGGGYVKPLVAHAPNVTSGGVVQFGFGVAASNYNQAEFNFNYTGGSGSNSNYLSFGLFGIPAILTCTGTSKVGIKEIAPETLLELTSTAPYITLHNSTHEDSDGGRESRIIFKGEQSGGEETELAVLEVSHDGAADDQLGKIALEVNTGAGLVDALEIQSTTDWVINKTSGVGIKVDLATPTFGWRDLKGKITNSKGATKPSEITYREGITQFQFGAGDDAGLEYHIPHDYVPGTDIHLHVHWSHISGAVTGGNVIFTYEITYCKGHNQAAFPATVTGTITGTASVTQYKHIISEEQISISTGSETQIDTDDLEPDGLILCRIEMTANNMTGATPSPFIHEVDVHYQSTNLGTKQKIPDFYT